MTTIKDVEGEAQPGDVVHHSGMVPEGEAQQKIGKNRGSVSGS